MQPGAKVRSMGEVTRSSRGLEAVNRPGNVPAWPQLPITPACAIDPEETVVRGRAKNPWKWCTGEPTGDSALCCGLDVCGHWEGDRT
jgi:hypothetical protein